MRTKKAVEELPVSVSVLATISNLNPVTLRRKLTGKAGYELTESDLKKMLAGFDELQGLISLCSNAVQLDLLEVMKERYKQDFENDPYVSIL